MTSVAGGLNQQHAVPGGGNLMNYTPIPGTFPFSGGYRKSKRKGRKIRRTRRRKLRRGGGDCGCTNKFGGGGSRGSRGGSRGSRGGGSSGGGFKLF